MAHTDDLKRLYVYDKNGDEIYLNDCLYESNGCEIIGIELRNGEILVYDVNGDIYNPSKCTKAPEDTWDRITQELVGKIAQNGITYNTAKTEADNFIRRIIARVEKDQNSF